jgi:thiol-disulfide isomerase/thioredoxin
MIIVNFMLSCNSESQIIKKENVLDSLFSLFDSVETISYKNPYVLSETNDTAVNYNYFEESHNSTGYLLNYNCATYYSNKFYCQDVFNAYDNIGYFFINNNSTITDYNQPQKIIHGIEQISYSLLTYVKFLKQTKKDYPERIIIKDTVIQNEDLYSIEFSNPDGIPLNGRPLFLLNEATLPLRLIVDKKEATVKYLDFGLRSYCITNIHFNPNRPDSIWSAANMPEFFRLRAGIQTEHETKYLISEGNVIPEWKFTTLQNANYKLLKESNYHILVFFTRKCGACIKEIPCLNKLNKRNNLKVTGVYFDNDIDNLKEFIKKYNIQYEVVINNDEKLKKLFRYGAFPVNYLIDNKGKIIYSQLGNREYFEEKIVKLTED